MKKGNHRYKDDVYVMKVTSAGAVVRATLLEEGDSIVTHVKAGHDYEPRTLRKWVDLLWHGKGHVVDVGCYSGLFSILAAKLGHGVTAFEPMPMNAERCAQNFALNGVGVDLHRGCATDKNGDVTLHYNPRVPWLTSGASLLYPSGDSKDALGIVVKGESIDSLGLADCLGIKVDVERGEPLVLAGAKETIARHKPFLLVEALGEDERTAVLASVEGYHVDEVLDERNLLLLPD